MIEALMLSSLQRARSGPAALGQAEASPPAEDFAAVLAGFARQTVETIRTGEQAAADGLKGQLPIQEVVDKVLAAEQALNAGLAVREKVVAAYLEISRMTI